MSLVYIVLESGLYQEGLTYPVALLEASESRERKAGTGVFTKGEQRTITPHVFHPFTWGVAPLSFQAAKNKTTCL